ncbi:hypothetical protein AB0D35_10965 [Streptomyces sp. NPDC048301]|uniref:hypothetical protein n=1 Tax=Streptomyces sp. NPDC048301 TaxID=3155631 RepID=UPI0034366CCD
MPDSAPASDRAPARALLVECSDCGRPGPAEDLPDGLCRVCRQAPAGVAGPAGQGEPTLDERDIEAHMRKLREKLRLP